jgi:hypothetical protein
MRYDKSAMYHLLLDLYGAILRYMLLFIRHMVNMSV